MGKLLSGHICPHGFSQIDYLAAYQAEAFSGITESMVEVWKRIENENPDTVVISTPHGLRIKGYHAIYTSSYTSAIYRQNYDLADEGFSTRLPPHDTRVSLSYEINREFSYTLADKMEKAGLHFVQCNYGTTLGVLSDIRMDWGVFIPLWFNKMEKKPNLVVLCPSRDTPLIEHVKMGELIKQTAEERNENIIYIASADQGHCHNSTGPYGFAPESKQYDEFISEIVKDNHLEKLLTINKDLLEKAKPDSLWQMLTLYGAIKDEKFKNDYFYYDCPSYFGMLTASFR